MAIRERWLSLNSLKKLNRNIYQNHYQHRRLSIKGEPQVRVNEEIRAPRIRVIDESGQLGVMSPDEALQIARKQGLDLIEIVPNAQPPVCKVMDFGKYKYEQSKKDRIQRKHQQVTLLKELRFHPNTDDHDVEFKLRHARKFLDDGHKVKATVVFKGREMTYTDQGRVILARIVEALADCSKVDQEAKLEGRSMTLILAPERGTKKKISKPKESQP
ncbi:MAG: translation initiation factor IF-3 [Bacteroidetes bacterium]|nr:MAG: translation initiation factor IF-3 [Bacteroidota bacterium]